MRIANDRMELDGQNFTFRILEYNSLSQSVKIEVSAPATDQTFEYKERYTRKLKVKDINGITHTCVDVPVISWTWAETPEFSFCGEKKQLGFKNAVTVHVIIDFDE